MSCQKNKWGSGANRNKQHKQRPIQKLRVKLRVVDLLFEDILTFNFVYFYNRKI